MSRLATSKTKSNPRTLEAFASLRFFGDRLEPRRITEILDTMPTLAYRKGDVFKKSMGQEIRGRTGLWLASSEGHVNSTDLNEHLDYLLTIVFSDDTEDKLSRLRILMHEAGIEADATCFWYGEHGARAPVIRDDIRSRFARIPAEVEEDFDTD
jgi:Domain of unknown function (DUF4279)